LAQAPPRPIPGGYQDENCAICPRLDPIQRRGNGQSAAAAPRMLPSATLVGSSRIRDHESGGKCDRTAFQQMLRDAAARRFDVLFFWSRDRLTREGTLAILKCLELLESYGVRWRSLTEPWIDSAGPFRDVIISLLASLAKQERVRISERVRAGLTRARQYGTRSGRSIGRPRALFQRDRALELRRQGLSWRNIAKTIGVSPSTIRQACHGPFDDR